MKLRAIVAIGLLLLPGCAAYKELEPKPELSPFEQGYIELKDGKDNFELDKDKKYYIRFPAPLKDHFYIVIVTRVKPLLHSYLTSMFDNGKGPIVPITDEASSNDSTLVYAVDSRVPIYYWVIDDVRRDLIFTSRYRFVPQWRYTFENKYAEYERVLASNTVDRSTYNSIDANFSFDRFDFAREIPSVEGKTGKIKSMKDELLRLESIFPSDIAAAKDTAYEKYVAFKSNVDDELTFQENYATVLNLFKREADTQGNTASFLEAVPYFTDILSQRERFPVRITGKTSRVFLGRLAEVTPYLDNILRTKNNVSKISPDPSLEAIGGLYRVCGQQIPAETEAIVRFINRFNVEAEGLQKSTAKFEALRGYFSAHIGSPTESFYTDLIAKAGEIKTSIPESQTERFLNYGSYNCAVMLGRELTNIGNKANDLQALYQNAAVVAGHISSRSWAPAEMGLRGLNDARGSSNSPEIATQRNAFVKQFENQIFMTVKSASQQRIDAFIKAHEMAIDNVAELYADSAFLPVHQLTFSSVGPADLMQKRRQIETYLENIKYNQFPESSIKAIYAEFSRNSRDRGVEKARAIVEHGRFYKGADKQVKGLITECDVQAAKWVVKPKDYRKLFALPITSNKQGMNEYMFRIRLEIPSEAQFPVFDVNLKLPQDLVEKAGQEQWYQSITIDKKPLKNEGRFRITSPTALNNFEVLITPVQMDKEGKNILEVRFKYPGFRVFEVSAMAQVPIIRKN